MVQVFTVSQIIEEKSWDEVETGLRALVQAALDRGNEVEIHVVHGPGEEKTAAGWRVTLSEKIVTPPPEPPP